MKQKEKTERTKERIIEAAVKEFGENGYAAATIGAVCGRHGIAKGLIYHNFAGKDELYLTCAARVFNDLTQFLKSQEAGVDLKQYMNRRIQYFSERPLYAGIFFEAILQPPQGLEAEIKKLKKDFDLFNKSIYQRAISSLTLRKGITEAAALEYYSIMQEMFNGYFSSPAYAGKNLTEKVADHEKKLAQMLDILLYGLAEKEKSL